MNEVHLSDMQVSQNYNELDNSNSKHMSQLNFNYLVTKNIIYASLISFIYLTILSSRQSSIAIIRYYQLIYPLKIQDHVELNAVNTKQHDTVILDNTENTNTKDIYQFENLMPITIKNEASNISQPTNKSEKRRTLAELRINRIKMLSQNQKYDERRESESVEHKQKKSQHKIMLALNLLVSVKSFYKQVTKNTRIFQRLTVDQHDIIGDVSSVYNMKQDNKGNILFNTMRIIALLIHKNCQMIPVFTPYGNIKRLWDLLNALLIITLTFFISLVLFFTLPQDQFSTLNQFSLIIFILDILMTFNTSIIDRGSLIDDRKKIAYLYLKKKFICDFVGISPFLINLLYDNNLKYSYLFFLFKWQSLQQTFERVTFYLNYQKNLKNVVDLVKLILLLCVVCHVFCGFWHALALYEMSQGIEKTWLDLFDLENRSIFSRYVFSFYYLAVTMITVGYGDITPQNTTEIIFTILTMFVTGITWGFSINKIGNIIDNIEKKDKSYRESMQVIHTLMREENIVTDLRDQISNYLQYLYNVIFSYYTLFFFLGFQFNQQFLNFLSLSQILGENQRLWIIIFQNVKIYLNKDPIKFKINQKQK